MCGHSTCLIDVLCDGAVFSSNHDGARISEVTNKQVLATARPALKGRERKQEKEKRPRGGGRHTIGLKVTRYESMSITLLANYRELDEVIRNALPKGAPCISTSPLHICFSRLNLAEEGTPGVNS